MQHHRIVGLAAIMLSTTVSCSMLHKHKTTAMPGTWQAEPITIDGDSKDWPSPYPNYDSKSMVAYATSNDRTNLYITMETGDEIAQLKILRQGMTVSIDTSGGRQTPFNINYPLLNDSDPLELPNAEGLQHMSQQFKARLYKQAETANQFSLDGFPACNGGFLATQTAPCGVKVRMRIDEYKQLVWEAQVPFKAIFGTDELPAAYAHKPISVCFAVKGLHRASPKGDNSTDASQNGMGGMGGNGAQGSFGGNSRQRGMSGGRNTAQTSPTDRLYETTKTWKHFGLEYR
jgi:hypothetical protein